MVAQAGVAREIRAIDADWAVTPTARANTRSASSSGRGPRTIVASTSARVAP